MLWGKWNNKITRQWTASCWSSTRRINWLVLHSTQIAEILWGKWKKQNNKMVTASLDVRNWITKSRRMNNVVLIQHSRNKWKFFAENEIAKSRSMNIASVQHSMNNFVVLIKHSNIADSLSRFFFFVEEDEIKKSGDMNSVVPKNNSLKKMTKLNTKIAIVLDE